MGNIVLLDDLTINKIAAGEVIERPASVVKELVENSIDAGATNITVEIKNGGISFIRITDNGKGFEKDDMEIAFERHATSKIRHADDLQFVKSMGFRGEALASIAAISKIELKSKTENSSIGNKIKLEAGKVIDFTEDGCQKGSIITIEDLFFNTPVRYKFLRKDFTESGYIEDVITRIALAYPDIAIKLINTGKTVIQTTGTGDIRNVIFNIFGKDISQNVIDVNYEYENIRISGVVGKPEIARSNRSNQLFFVNKRYVKDRILTSAAEQVYKGLVQVGKFGFLILNIDMNPEQVDVNVHPAKLEVRFEDENKIYQAVYHAMKEVLVKQDSTQIEKDEESKENIQLEKKKFNSDSDIYDETEKQEKTNLGLFQKLLNRNKNKKEEIIEKQDGVDTFKEDENYKYEDEEKYFSDNVIAQIFEKRRLEKENTINNNEMESKIETETKAEVENEVEVENEIQDNVEESTDIINNEEVENITDIEEVQEVQEELEEQKISLEEDSNANNDNNDNNEESRNIIEEIYDENQIENIQDIENGFEGQVVEEKDIYQEIRNSIEHELDENKEEQKQEFDEVQENNDNNLEEENFDKYIATNTIEENVSQDVQNIQNEENDQEENINYEEQEENVNELDQTNVIDVLVTKNELDKTQEITGICDVPGQYEVEANKEKLEQENINNSEKKLNPKEKFIEELEKIEIKDTKNDNSINYDKEDFSKIYSSVFGVNPIGAIQKEEKDEEPERFIFENENYTLGDNVSLFENDKQQNTISYKFIGTAFKTCFLIEIKQDLYIVDSKVARQKVLFEELNEKYNLGSLQKQSQLMLLPDIIELNNKQMDIAKENEDIFKKAGFTFEEFGDNTLKLTSVPEMCLELDTKELFIEALNEVNTVSIIDKDKIEVKLIQTIARNISNNENIEMSEEEANKLIDCLLKCNNPFVDDEQRPIVLKMSRNDIERKFSRR